MALPNARTFQRGLASGRSTANLGPCSFFASRLPRSNSRALKPLAAAVAAPPEVGAYSTFVPRSPGVTDGQWGSIDVAQVKKAEEDAKKVARRNKDEVKGTVLLGRSQEELEALAVKYGQPKFRGKQLLDALLKGARSLDEINNVPKEWREKMAADGVRTGRSIIHLTVPAPDGTMKFLLQLADGRLLECVGIPSEGDDAKSSNSAKKGDRSKNRPSDKGQSTSADSGSSSSGKRLTVCVSSQVGCPMRCRFCATGQGGFARNLKDYEIFDQVMTIQEVFGKRVSNVVFMGMGEPLLNLPNVSASIRLMNEQYGLGARYITVSTVGVPNAIVMLADSGTKATLAVSIHAPNQALRESLIPSAKAYPLEALMQDCVKFYEKTGRRVTYEYTLMDGVNDGVEHAQELADLLNRHKLRSHVNVIPWNTVEGSEYKRPSGNRIHAFKQTLEANSIPATIRVTRGIEAGAACGQLRNQHQKIPLEKFSVPA